MAIPDLVVEFIYNVFMYVYVYMYTHRHVYIV